MAVGRGLLRGAAVLLAAVLAAGCGAFPENVFLAEGFASPGTPYGEALLRNTRQAELYEGFDTVAKLWGTWKNDEVRSALTESSVRAYRLEGAEAEALREEQRAAAANAREFHLSLYSPKKQWNDLDSPTTLWRLYLELPDGRRFTPVQVVYLPKSDKNPVEYPYVSRWTREYSVLFPLLGERETQAHLTLLLTGPLGNMKLKF
ncbi:MAG: hypothetical protein HY900_13285 [Deltaproteobacteria bacterium]|nr:hypothetical protein [Deltaproteobacteria bacterium]